MNVARMRLKSWRRVRTWLMQARPSGEAAHEYRPPPVLIASYAIAALVVAGLIGWIVLDNRAQRRSLARLQAHGVTRRSEQSA